MTLRGPPAHLRRAPGCRRSGPESWWGSLTSEDVLTPVAHTPRAPRPQSAIEGGQLDGWLKHLQERQSNSPKAKVHDQVLGFNSRTTSMPALNKEPARCAWRQLEIPSFSGGSFSCGSSSLCESSMGSQESLQTGLSFPPERRGSWERAHFTQAPKKEQTQLSYLAPVKTGWLPIQRRVMMVADAGSIKNQLADPSVGQVKLKQPITPIFEKTQPTPRAQDGGVDRGKTSPNTFDVKMRTDQGSPIIKQVPEKQSFPANEGDRPVSWQALRRGWNTNRVCPLPGGSQSTVLSTGISPDSNRKPPLMKTTSFEPLKHTSLHQTTSAAPCRPHTLLQGANSTVTYRPHNPFHRTSSIQPVRATAPLCTTNCSSHDSDLKTSSTMTTLIPQNKSGFSSITISSRKVNRSASLPGASSQSSESTPPHPAHQAVDTDTRQVMVQRKATMVKVTDQSVMSNPVLSTKSEGPPPPCLGSDTVVRRRKATIVEVTEQRESYSSVKSGMRHQEYRHSYTEGLYKDNCTWSQGNHSQCIAASSYHHLGSTKRPHPAVTPNTSTSGPETNVGTVHRSTLSLFLKNPSYRAAPNDSEVSPKAVGQRWDRPNRPLSWYGNVFGHAEPSEENVPQAAARKLSFPQETNINHVNSDGSVISPGTAVKEAGPRVADNLKSNRGDAEDPERRASPCLTLIKASDPHSHQSPEEVLALNAAAIIANIKLQRELSKTKTQNGNSENESSTSHQGNTVTVGRNCMRPHPDRSPVQHHDRPTAVFIPLSLDPERSLTIMSLQEALQRSRPDFIIHSQGRVRELKRRAQEGKQLADAIDPQSEPAIRQQRARSDRSLNGNLLKPRDRAITGKEVQLRSMRTSTNSHIKHNPASRSRFAEVKREKSEEKKREVCLSNRQRVMLFKKKLLDQILQRSNN
ncbi:(E2-independent) E3 ubiquitin-conjugating enzyme FATS isoform X1 [Channa argus]|uniref:(E2-independent) E3 ubiquitin-conjugating enzyme FATS isoform X1 n=1 Tax=Channa argus TaxID=215402 RepID=UPI003521F33B